MTEDHAGRALQALLALEPDDASPSEKDAPDFASAPLPPLDARVEKYMRAMQEAGFDAGDRAQARAHILAAMAEDLAEPDRNSEASVPAPVETPARGFDRSRRPSRSFRAPASLWSRRSIRWTGVFAASAAALLVIGWSGAWLYALHSLNTTVAEWRDWEGKSGRQYSCATEGFGGSPVRVEIVCGGLNAAITTANGSFTAGAKELRVAVDLFHPDVITSKIEGPASFAEAGKPDSFTGSWSHAEATVTGPKPTPDGVSIALADFRLDRSTNDGAEPVASAGHLIFQARLDPVATAATKKPAYDLTSDIAAGTLPSGPPMAARPFEARVKAVLHGTGDMTPKPLPERIKGWQRNGGSVEMTNIEIRGSAADANAQGRIALSEHGGIEGALELSGAIYGQLFEALTGKTLATAPAAPEAAHHARQHAARRLPGGTPKSGPSQSGTLGAAAPSPEETNAPNQGRKLPALRFEDGTAYFGSNALGRLPALF